MGHILDNFHLSLYNSNFFVRIPNRGFLGGGGVNLYIDYHSIDIFIKKNSIWTFNIVEK